MHIKGWNPTFRFTDDRDPVTLKKLSSRPCVLPWRLLLIFLVPFRIRSSPASSGSFHFKSTESISTTSGDKNNCRASLYSQPSGTGYFW
uniref:Uncharacterized protein n=1 Tax=Erpetoichthys calabaricus TaxID=27687 RepID=A0A8C4SIT2_ERPCA